VQAVIAAALASAALAACPAGTPAAMTLDGVPATLVSGRSYTASLAPTGAGEAAGGWTLGVFDRLGRGWSADLPGLGFRQAFSVGLTGAPYVVSGTYAEVLGDGTCERVLSVTAAVERRVLAVSCGRAVVAPRTLRVRCGGRRVTGLKWRGWHSDVARGRGAGGVRVRLSRPEACATVDGFIYTRARVDGRRYVVDCPLED
jgi:hypothetical protein